MSESSVPSRRRVLSLIPAGIAALAIPGIAEQAAFGGTRGTTTLPCGPNPPVTMGWICNEGWELRYRGNGTHPHPTQHVFQEHFWWYCSHWINTTNYYINRFVEGG